ncbi:tetratricopeptide repeat protein [Roseimaritima sediminicola]|uniref:tetratricopeptide repeat protein n=1 Tax=Roseimaritima sediminicola TaxID=2662066 RepID=UPI0012982663|nr:tetratricopeptide repeat protein [Roseimaritima sediminicola]
MNQGKTKEAISIFEDLASEGDDKAMVQLGIYYYEGIGVKQDYTKAMDWWLEAFAKQNADAFVNLGVMHRDGHAVPQNRKIAYCIFLTTHMNGLGSQSTQLRANGCLRKILNDVSKDDIKECLSNYTLGYLSAYLKAKGKMKGIPDEHRPSKDNPALKDLDWWLDGELDSIFGPPTEEEKKAREEAARQREMAIKALQHTLVFQVKFSKDSVDQYRSCDVITDQGMGSSPISKKKLQDQGGHLLYEDEFLIYANRHRWVTVENHKGEALVFKVNHPVKPHPSDWSKWQNADFILQHGMDKFSLLRGEEPKNRVEQVQPGKLEFRFKVVKE